jgi:hypothetical protein
MNKQSLKIHSANEDRLPKSTSTDRPDATRRAAGARILRRWSVADLIARAGGAPRAFA